MAPALLPADCPSFRSHPSIKAQPGTCASRVRFHAIGGVLSVVHSRVLTRFPDVARLISAEGWPRLFSKV